MPPVDPPRLDTLYDILIAGGWLMWPIALCSVIALAYIVERSLRLRASRLSPARFGDDLLAAARSGGASTAYRMCTEANTSVARVLAAGLRRADSPTLERDKAVEDAGSREVARLTANLRPLVVIAVIAPLLGLLGTVWGMIDAFTNIALAEGLGRPEALAAGISMALVTTAAGLAVAIPVQAAYYWFRSRIDRFVRTTEDLYDQLVDQLHAPAGERT